MVTGSTSGLVRSWWSGGVPQQRGHECRARPGGGVSSIALASPPQRNTAGCLTPRSWPRAGCSESTEVYAVGGAQAVAMFAYGTEDCQRVDMVTGPGNVYVAAAKRLLKGVIGIDAEAGVTEIAILADGAAPPAFVAADLIAQAEHDENASCLLVTDDPDLLDAVDAEVMRQVRDRQTP